MVLTSTPPWPLLWCAMHGCAPARPQYGSSPSYSPLTGLNTEVVPSRVVNGTGEPQQMVKNFTPFLGAWCTSDFASTTVMTLERFVTENVTTPPSDVQDSSGNPPPVAASRSLLGAALATA